jgi:hypothetical protein
MCQVVAIITIILKEKEINFVETNCQDQIFILL